MSREVCGICWCPYDEKTGKCGCSPCATKECMPSECPNCAELDKKLTTLEQISLELCETCGWRTLIPGDVCLNCTRSDPDKLSRIAHIVAAAVFQERESCARICEAKSEQWWRRWKHQADPLDQGASDGADECAQAIRNRK